MVAAAYGDVYTARKNMADAGKTNADGFTALMYACQANRMELVKMLIKVEDVRMRNKEGCSAVDLAFYGRALDACQFLEEYCISHGYNDLKPKPRSTFAQQARAAR